VSGFAPRRSGTLLQYPCVKRPFIYVIHPFNPTNQYNPNNPLNPANRYNPAAPFEPLNRST
jgi:hypothetical protein